MLTVMSAKRARTAILRGNAPAGLLVQGDLSLDGEPELRALPEGLEVRTLNVRDCDGLRALPARLRCTKLDISGTPLTALPDDIRIAESLMARDCPRFSSLPAGLRLDRLVVGDCPSLRALPAGLHCQRLAISRTQIASLPPDLKVADMLEADDCEELASLCVGLRLRRLVVSGCVRLTALPDDLRVTETLDVSGCTGLERLPEGIEPDQLVATGCTRLAALPDNLTVTHDLTLSGCSSLESLPPNLHVRRLLLDGCTSLRALPEGLEAKFLDISNCIALEEWPLSGLRSLRVLVTRNCRGVRSLPLGVERLDSLDIGGCTELRRLPEDLRVTGGVEVADTALEQVPPHLSSKLRWRGVRVPVEVVLHSEKIRARAVLEESNTEVRRVMIERMGFERFMYEAGALILDEDRDLGGPRQLLRVEFRDDEALVCLSVFDPSTGRHYLLRVPPWMTGCRQAAAWIAGFDDPDDYHPTAET